MHKLQAIWIVLLASLFALKSPMVLPFIAVVCALLLAKMPVSVRFVKWVSWLSVLPFAISYVAAPAGLEWVYSHLAWFLLWIAALQWVLQSDRFVLFNTALVLAVFAYFFREYTAAFFVIWAALFFKWTTPQGYSVRFVVQLFVLVFATILVLVVRPIIPKWNSDAYYASRQIMGFQSTSVLGSFGEDFVGHNQHEILIRDYAETPINYLQGMVYQKYSRGVWRRPDSVQQKQYPMGRNLEYSFFSRDSQEGALKFYPHWIQLSKPIEQLLFISRNTRSIAADVDSLIWKFPNTVFALEPFNHRGYYIDVDTNAIDTLWHKDDLQVPNYLVHLVDSLSVAWELRGLNGVESETFDIAKVVPLIRAKSMPQELYNKIAQQFEAQFKYSLAVPLVKGEDPLFAFVRSKQGYCEYFATLTVMLLRQNGVQARYAAGFARPQKVGRAWVYYRKDAHAWIEYFDGKKWVLQDPTPPSYVEQNQISFIKRAVVKLQNIWTWSMHLFRDGAWRQSVDNFGAKSRQWLDSSAVQIAGFVVVALALGYLIRMQYKRKKSAQKNVTQSQNSITQKQQNYIAQLKKAEQILAKQGLVRDPSTPIAVWLKTLPSNASTTAVRLLEEYQKNRWKY